MAKAKTTAFFCKECGYESSKWLGQCPACRAWNTLVEEPVAKMAPAAGKGRMSAERGAGMAAAKPALLSEIRLEKEDRISTGFKELAGKGRCRWSTERSGYGWWLNPLFFRDTSGKEDI